MADLSEAEVEGIRAFVENENGRFPKLADLQSWWDAIAPDCAHQNFPTIERLRF